MLRPTSRLHTSIGVFLVLLMIVVAVMTLTGQTSFSLWIPLLLRQGNNLDGDDNNQQFRRSFSDMPLDGSEFWDVIAARQGLTNHDRETDGNVLLISSNRSSTSSSSTYCHDFFAVWPGDCVDSFSYLNERLRALSAQMSVFNATLTVFTTDLTGCTAFSRYPKIRVEKFNATEELLRHGFGDAMTLINQWDKTKFTRISDILRLCLAYRHRMSYLDTDVHFLQLQRHLYEKPYVGAQLYSDNKNAIEITNAAFCLPRAVLSDMMGYQRQRVLQRGNKYKFFYTELGPSMFHHVLMNRRAIPLYSQNHPADPSIKHIARDIHNFGHKQLHLTGHVRKGNKEFSFDQLINAIRKQTGLPQLILPDMLTSSSVEVHD